MFIDLSDVLSEQHKPIDVSVPLELDEMKIPGGPYFLKEKSPVHIKVEHVKGKEISVTGECSLIAVIPCDRCLEDVPYVFELNFEREADMKLTEEERKGSDEEYNFLEEMCINTDTLIQNELLINWPIRVLCQEDCKGICSNCGANLNHGECGCDRQVLDPRMAAFSDIFSKFKEV